MKQQLNGSNFLLYHPHQRRLNYSRRTEDSNLITHMNTETFIIVNPTAGDSQAEKRWQDFENDLKKNRIHYHAVMTQYQNHATELISEADSSGYNRIGVFSGD